MRSKMRLLVCFDHSCDSITPDEMRITTMQQARSMVQITWDEPPRRVLIVKRPNDTAVTQFVRQVAQWLMTERRLAVVAESVVTRDLGVEGVIAWDPDSPHQSLGESIDLVLCFGGDGTTLWVSKLFPKSCPPIMTFAMGSLGFLSTFRHDRYQQHINDLFERSSALSLRARLVRRRHRRRLPTLTDDASRSL